jgi:endoglucanase
LKGFEVRYRLALLLLALAVPAAAQDRGADMRTAFARVQHLKHGINASEWFAQHASDYSAAFTGRYTDEGDIALMAKLGFDNVRLGIDPVPLEQSMKSGATNANQRRSSYPVMNTNSSSTSQL